LTAPRLLVNLAAQKVTLINSKDEGVSLYFDIDTHLPIEKSYTCAIRGQRKKTWKRKLQRVPAHPGNYDALRIHPLFQRGYADGAFHNLRQLTV